MPYSIPKSGTDLAPAARSPWLDARQRFVRNRAALVSLIILALIALVCLVGPWLSPHAYDDTDWNQMGIGPTWDQWHLFGTDELGRDLLVRTLIGGRISLTVGVLASTGVALNGGIHWPTADAGWIGLGLLTFLYGTGFTILFTVLPRLGVVGNSAIMNVEPVFALVMAWAFLGQTISWIQVLGALIVVATVMALGLRKK